MPETDQTSVSPNYVAKVVDSVDAIPATQWQSLAGTNPFVSHSFLSGMDLAGCTSPEAGWFTRFITLHRDNILVGCVPCYFKTNSRGEFVFDHGWADAFKRNGLEYFPKLLVAAPFTPVQGPRLLAVDGEARAILAQALISFTQSIKASSIHVLFIDEQDRAALSDAGFMIREGVQFHWSNDGYKTLEDFLSSLTHDKRKKIRQDTRYVADADIEYRWLEGNALTTEHLEFFYACYCNTYKEHWSTPYLSLDFFLQMHETRTLHFVLVLAHRQGRSVACALNVLGSDALYGRYWGTTEFSKGLHFETCYMQAIEYCIAKGVAKFEGGAQGEHKMARGLLPHKTYSAHWIADRRFAEAIESFLIEESVAINGYVKQLESATPFKSE